MLCRQMLDKKGTMARHQSGSSAMILLILLLSSLDIVVGRFVN